MTGQQSVMIYGAGRLSVAATISEIDAAVKKLEDRSYGVYVISAIPTPTERLEAIPHANMRVA